MRKYRSLATIAAAAVALAVSSAVARSATPKADPSQDGMTRGQADAILTELREMRLLLEKLVKQPGPAAAPSPPPIVTLKLPPEALMLGDKKAPLTMVEYIDLQCPYCKKFEDIAFADIRRNLIDTGRVRYFSRDFPLEMHANAMKAAVAAHCAGEQGQFWRMREVLLTNAASLGTDAILGYAKTAGLDTTAFGSCFSSSKYDGQINAGLAEGKSIGVEGTPSFLLGKSTPDGVTGRIIVGLVPYAAFEAEVKRLEAAK